MISSNGYPSILAYYVQGHQKESSFSSRQKVDTKVGDVKYITYA